MKTSILIYATCFIVSGCAGQLRFPSLSSALSSLTGYGSGAASSAQSQSGQSAAASPYSGLVRDYGRNLMMAMSSIYPTLFKPPQQQQLQQSQPAQSQSPFDSFASSLQQSGSQGLFSSGSAPASFSFGGSTFSISPSLPFGALSGASSAGQQQQQQPQLQAAGSHSPFGASFGSSINSPTSFGPLSNAPFLPQQSMPSFAPPSSYSAAFEAANGGTPSHVSQSQAAAAAFGAAQGAQSGAGPSGGSFGSMPSFGGPQQHDTASPISSQSVHQPQTASLSGQQAHNSLAAFGGAAAANSQQGQAALGQQYLSQQYRPDMMSIAASAPVPSSNSYSNYGSLSSGAQSQQVPASQASYQQPSYR